MQQLISIIIPAYNVEQYLNQCLESVNNQTYKNIEIIIVYDKSQDNTLKICREWVKKDNRFFLILNEKRCGLGTARNMGLLKSRGEYIIYLDSDDWIKEDFIEKLYNEISSKGADYVSSRGYYEVNEEEIIINHAIPAGPYDGEIKETLLICDNVCVWKKIYRKQWIDENQLINPLLFYYEDWGMYPTIIKEAKKVSVIEEVGVYYRHFRKGCLSNDYVSKEMLLSFEKALKYIFEYLKNHGVKYNSDKNLAYYCIRDYYYRLKYAKKLENKEAINSLNDIRHNILEKEFGEFDVEKNIFIAFGSFSLRWEIHKSIMQAENLNKHYCFSSIISVMSKCSPIKLRHDNSFREKQIEYDITSELLNIIRTVGKNGILFIDFMEERYDLMEVENNRYLTMSDAFLGSERENICFKRIIKWGSSEYMVLWKKKCLEFIKYLKKYFNENQIIYVANRMALNYGDFNEIKLYNNWESIARVNAIISNMEKFFLNNFNGIIKILPNNKTAFTDKNFRLGCEPQYLNNIYYSIVAVDIFSKIIKGRS